MRVREGDQAEIPRRVTGVSAAFARFRFPVWAETRFSWFLPAGNWKMRGTGAKIREWSRCLILTGETMILFAADDHFNTSPGRNTYEEIAGDYPQMKFVENDWSCFTACDLAKECDLLILNMIADTCGLPIPDGKAAGAVKNTAKPAGRCCCCTVQVRPSGLTTGSANRPVSAGCAATTRTASRRASTRMNPTRSFRPSAATGW